MSQRLRDFFQRCRHVAIYSTMESKTTPYHINRLSCFVLISFIQRIFHVTVSVQNEINKRETCRLSMCAFGLLPFGKSANGRKILVNLI